MGKKAVSPPLGLLTVAALLPEKWNKRLVDLNTASLKDEDLQWADYVFVSAMGVQRPAAAALVRRCKAAGKKIVAGGPLFTAEEAFFDEVDHFILNEAELTLPPFLADLEKGIAQRIYRSGRFCRSLTVADSALGAAQAEAVRVHERAIFTRLSFCVRLLQCGRRMLGGGRRAARAGHRCCGNSMPCRPLAGTGRCSLSMTT